MTIFKSFSSGSCGNCSLLATDASGELEGLLIDAGVSARKVKKTLLDDSIPPECIKAVLVTHDHFDHIRHLGSLCARLHIRLYSTETILRSIRRHPYCSSVSGTAMELGKWTEILPGVEALCFKVPHDAPETVGYAIKIDSHFFVIMTDIGEMTQEALSYSSLADTLVIESNYDSSMLLGGDYDYALKMRISKGHGHLSNSECGEALKKLYSPRLRNIFLCHLSGNNNTPELCLASARQALSEVGAETTVSSGGQRPLSLRVLPRGIPTPVFYL